MSNISICLICISLLLALIIHNPLLSFFISDDSADLSLSHIDEVGTFDFSRFYFCFLDVCDRFIDSEFLEYCKMKQMENDILEVSPIYSPIFQIMFAHKYGVDTSDLEAESTEEEIEDDADDNSFSIFALNFDSLYGDYYKYTIVNPENFSFIYYYTLLYYFEPDEYYSFLLSYDSDATIDVYPGLSY